MANFCISGSAFRWIKVRAEDQKGLGQFSFMVMIEENGRINFFYKEMPEIPLFVVSQHHPVKIGLADAHRQKVSP